jgi:hypothetical protein
MRSSLKTPLNLIFLLPAILILAARGNIPERVKNSKEFISLSDTTLRLEYFKKIPDTIDGCGDFYTYDTTKLAKNKYIFVSNLTDFAIIKIKGARIVLKLDSLESKAPSDDHFTSVYKGKGYKAILKVNRVKAYDEGGLYKGTLEIISGGSKTIFKVHGESGC